MGVLTCAPWSLKKGDPQPGRQTNGAREDVRPQLKKPQKTPRVQKGETWVLTRPQLPPTSAAAIQVENEPDATWLGSLCRQTPTRN